MTEYIVQIEDSEKNMSERFVGQLRSYPELIRCKDCKWFGDIGCAISIVDDTDKPSENDYCSFAERKDHD